MELLVCAATRLLSLLYHLVAFLAGVDLTAQVRTEGEAAVNGFLAGSAGNTAHINSLLTVLGFLASVTVFLIKTNQDGVRLLRDKTRQAMERQATVPVLSRVDDLRADLEKLDQALAQAMSVIRYLRWPFCNAVVILGLKLLDNLQYADQVRHLLGATNVHILGGMSMVLSVVATIALIATICRIRRYWIDDYAAVEIAPQDLDRIELAMKKREEIDKHTPDGGGNL